MAERVFGDTEVDVLHASLAQKFEDPESYYETLAKIIDAYSKLSKTANASTNQALTQANKLYSTQMKAKADWAGKQTKYLADLNSGEVRLQSAALKAMVDDAKSMRTTMQKMREMESANLHPWFETARAEAIRTEDRATGAAFWGALIGTVTQTGGVVKDDPNIAWLVTNLNSQIKDGKIGDWHAMRDISEPTRVKLQEMWDAAEQSMKTDAALAQTFDRFSKGTESVANALTTNNKVQLDAAIRAFAPSIQALSSAITQDKSPEQLALDAQSFVNSRLAQFDSNVVEAAHDAILAMTQQAGLAKPGSKFPEFSMAPNAAWRGYVLQDPKFQAWARDNGFNELGSVVRDEAGNIVSVVPGADAIRAMRKYGRAIYHVGDPEKSGYGKKEVIISGELGTRGVSYGTAVDADGNSVPVIRVDEGGSSKLFTGVRSQTEPGRTGESGRMDFIPVRMSEFENREINWQPENAGQFEEMQGGTAQEAASRYYNDFIAQAKKAAEVNSSEEIKITPGVGGAEFNIIVGTAMVGDEIKKAMQIVSDDTSQWQQLVMGPTGWVAVEALEGFQPVSEAQKLSPAFAEEHNIKSIADITRQFTDKISTETPLIKKALIPVTKYDAAVSEFKTKKAAEKKAAEPVVPKLTPVAGITAPGSAQTGVNYGINPETGLYRIKLASGDFVELTQDKFKQLYPDKPDDEEIETVADRRRQRRLEELAITDPDAAEIVATQRAANADLDSPMTRAERRKESAKVESGAKYDAAGRAMPVVQDETGVIGKSAGINVQTDKQEIVVPDGRTVDVAPGKVTAVDPEYTDVDWLKREKEAAAAERDAAITWLLDAIKTRKYKAPDGRDMKVTPELAQQFSKVLQSLTAPPPPGQADAQIAIAERTAPIAPQVSSDKLVADQKAQTNSMAREQLARNPDITRQYPKDVNEAHSIETEIPESSKLNLQTMPQKKADQKSLPATQEEFNQAEKDTGKTMPDVMPLSVTIPSSPAEVPPEKNKGFFSRFLRRKNKDSSTVESAKMPAF